MTQLPSDQSQPSWKLTIRQFLVDWGIPMGRVTRIMRAGLDFKKVSDFNDSILTNAANYTHCCQSLREIKQEALTFGDSLEKWLGDRVSELRQLQEVQSEQNQDRIDNLFEQFDNFSPGVPLCSADEFNAMADMSEEELARALREKRNDFAKRFNKLHETCNRSELTKQVDTILQTRQMAQALGLVLFIFECAKDLGAMDDSQKRLCECKTKLERLYTDNLTPILNEFKAVQGEVNYRVIQERLWDARGYCRGLKEEINAAVAEAQSRKYTWGLNTVISGLSFATSVWQLRSESVTSYASSGVRMMSYGLTALEGVQVLGSATMTYWAHLDEQSWTEFRARVEECEAGIDDVLKMVEKAQQSVAREPGIEGFAEATTP